MPRVGRGGEVGEKIDSREGGTIEGEGCLSDCKGTAKGGRKKERLRCCPRECGLHSTTTMKTTMWPLASTHTCVDEQRLCLALETKVF